MSTRTERPIRLTGRRWSLMCRRTVPSLTPSICAASRTGTRTGGRVRCIDSIALATARRSVRNGASFASRSMLKVSSKVILAPIAYPGSHSSSEILDQSRHFLGSSVCSVETHRGARAFMIQKCGNARRVRTVVDRPGRHGMTKSPWREQRNSCRPTSCLHGEAVFLNRETSAIQQSLPGLKHSGTHRRAQHLSSLCLRAYQNPSNAPSAASRHRFSRATLCESLNLRDVPSCSRLHVHGISPVGRKMFASQKVVIAKDRLRLFPLGRFCLRYG